jgi:hypothetical protein
MSIFDTIKNAIFHHSAAVAPKTAPAAPSATQTSTQAATGAAPARPQTPPAAPSTSQPVDVEQTLESLQSKKGEPLNWRTSIVDLMKVLDLDSSLAHRKELAKELGYSGDTNDSASMNIWLHKQVMTKLAANGGKVPPSLQG